MKAGAHNRIKSFLDILFPQNVKCIFCEYELQQDNGVCERCLQTLPLIRDVNTCQVCGGRLIGTGTVCVHCKDSHFYFGRAFCVSDYVDPIKSKIIQFKQSGYKYIGRGLAWILWLKFCQLDICPDVIIPMPNSQARDQSRSFNQCEILCQFIKEHYGRVYSDVVIRVKDTPHQTGLSRENRKKNLDGAFRVIDKNRIKNKTVLIIDDIFTTGSTLSECSKVVKRAGASKIYCLALARTIIRLDKLLE